jgi:hypothetical protein
VVLGVAVVGLAELAVLPFFLDFFDGTRLVVARRRGDVGAGDGSDEQACGEGESEAHGFSGQG